MKYTKILLVPLILTALIFSMIPTASATFDRTYTAYYASPTVDGQIDDEWSAVEWTYVDKPFDGIKSTDTVVRVKILWDECNLYFLAEIVDNSYNADNDMLEIYLDQTNTKTVYYDTDDSQTRFRLNGTVVKGVPNVAGKNAQTNAECGVTKAGQNTYVLEMALFYTAGQPQAGNIMGLEFLYMDAKAGLTYVDTAEYEAGDAEAYRWNIDQPGGDKAAWMSTEHWGTLVLADEDGNLPGYVPPLTVPPEEIEDTIITKSPATTRPRPEIKTMTTKLTETTDLTSTQEDESTTDESATKKKKRDTEDDDDIDTSDISDDTPIITALLASLAAALVAVIVLIAVLIVSKKKNSKK